MDSRATLRILYRDCIGLSCLAHLSIAGPSKPETSNIHVPTEPPQRGREEPLDARGTD